MDFNNIEPQPKEQLSVMFINIGNQQKEKSSVMFINQFQKIYKIMSNLRNLLEANQYIDCNRCNHKNRHPRHNLPKTYGGRKPVCPVWIYPTEHFLSHPRTSFRINERLSNKYDTHKSKSAKEDFNEDI